MADVRNARFLLSFDIDGTLYLGDPPGGISREMVLRAKEAGFVIGSCSDRSPSSQQTMWEKLDIDPDFVARKHMLDEVKERFSMERYLHIGDRDLDKQFAEMAGFDFMWAHEAEAEPWLEWLEARQQELFVLSFDIDGTLYLGDPPGGITREMVVRAKEAGFIIGSCSDRSPSSQQTIWEKLEITPDFVARKHMLDEVKVNITAARYLHIGDRDLDKQFAEMAGFDFMWAHEAEAEPWLEWLTTP
jgi:predicted mannosyl-3-phosphoglycerate phosphatase (HAD superfamily)